MGPVKETKKKNSSQTSNDNKSDCTEGEAEYETESIIKYNEKIRSRDKTLRVEGVNHKKRYVENANFPRQSKFIDNKWSD